MIVNTDPLKTRVVWADNYKVQPVQEVGAIETHVMSPLARWEVVHNDPHMGVGSVAVGFANYVLFRSSASDSGLKYPLYRMLAGNKLGKHVERWAILPSFESLEVAMRRDVLAQRNEMYSQRTQNALQIFDSGPVCPMANPE